MTATVRAAGGLVWRREGDGALEVLVVHRPRYDDWSLPKGKADPGESDEDCARREVEEETGLHCVLGPFVGRSDYVDHKGRDKVALFWAMEPVAGAFEPGDEVDEVQWLPLEQAEALLTYPRDADMLRRLPAALAGAA